MKKILIVTTVSGFVPQFEMNNVRILQEMGYEVHYASNFKNPHYGKDNSRLDGTGIKCHQVDFVRSPFRIDRNVRAYQQLKQVMKELNPKLVHCHTPVGGVLARLTAKKYRKTGTKVIYTAHGFHFYKGAPMINWLCYYPVEWLLARWTDVLITINEEDCQRAKRFPLPKNGRVEKINGIGLDVEKYRNIHVNREEKRAELGIAPDEYLLISVGELSKRKNHQSVIKALTEMREECYKKKLRYLICGEGEERDHLEKLVKENELEKIVLMPGYRADVKEWLAVSDCFVFPSKQEGLPVALMEAMAVGLPCVCSDIRGNRDLVRNGAAIYDDNIGYLKKYMERENGNILFCNEGYEKILEKYSTAFIEKSMKQIYQNEERHGN